MSAGFFHCEHCAGVVTPSPTEIEAAEDGPDGRLVDLRCPVCGRRDVDWHQPTGPEPVSDDRAAEWFRKIYERVSLL